MHTRNQLIFRNAAKAAITAALFVLAACGGSGSSSEPNSGPPPPSAVTLPDLTQSRLLVDSELTVNPRASNFQPSADVQQWLRENHFKLRSLVFDQDFNDLQPFKTQIGARPLVMLGESSHGSREFNLIKVRMIKFLHQQMGFNVLAMESSTLGCLLQDRKFLARDPNALTQRCYFPVWLTSELDELMRYIASTHTNGGPPLRIVGFDVQRSSSFESAADLQNWLHPVLSATGDPALADTRNVIATAYRAGVSGFSCRINGAAAAAECNDFDALRGPLPDSLLSLETRALASAQQNSLTPEQRRERVLAGIALGALRDRILSAQQARGTSLANFQDREPFMANTITRLAREAFPNEKMIIWAHNAHIAKNSTGFPDSGPPMGSFLRQQWGDSLYGVGIFMLRGKSTLNISTRQTVDVVAPAVGSLEAHIASLALPAVVMPVPAQDQPGAGDDWLHRPLPQLHWGYVPRVERLDLDYNAALVIDTSTIPQYSP